MSIDKKTERHMYGLDDIVAASDHKRNEKGSKKVEDSGMQSCQKVNWSLASLAWLNKELRHWKTVCLPAFVIMVRCQSRNSSIPEE